MIATTFQNAHEFLLKAQAVLEANEAANNLLLGVSFRLRQRPENIKTRPYFITIEDDQGLALAGVMVSPHQLMVYSDRAEVEPACRLVIQDLEVNGWATPGVIGPVGISKQFAETWAKLTGGTFRQGMSQRIYELRQVIPPEPVAGILRVATLADLELVRAWAIGFVQEALGEMERAEIEQSIQKRVAEGEVYLWDNKGQSVSMAAKARPMSTGIVVNLVYTPPEFRKQGYATACVAALSQLLLDSGWQFCALFTDLDNPTSNAIYQKIGYVPVCDFQQYLFK